MKNNYSSFISTEEMQQELEKISSKEQIKMTGTPLCYDEESIYVDHDFGHNLIIGGPGSGKTQSTILPKLYTAINATHSIIVDDGWGEIKSILDEDLKQANYKVFTFDFDNYTGNKWNPLDLVYKLYTNNKLDDAVMMLEKIANYILSDANSTTADPFWKECSVQLFVGTALYLFEKEKRLVTIQEIANKASKMTKEEYDVLNDNDPAKAFLKVVMSAPTDTKGSIISVFNNSIMCYSYSNKINEFLSESDFNIEDLLNLRVALFIRGCHNKQYLTNLISIFIEELVYVGIVNRNKYVVNVILDDFNDFVPFENLGKILSNVRGVHIGFTLCSTSLHRLSELYGETSLEYILSYFDKIIFLHANDEYTLEYVSKMCGNKNSDERLITPTELKLLKQFEAVVLKNRHLPFKTKLLPFYQYKK